MAKYSPHQNFPGIQSMIFSKRTIRTTFIPKIRMVQSCVWKLKARNLQNCHFWPKNVQILATNGQILAISEFSRHMHYDFLKEDHKGSFHTKNYENLQWRLEDIGQNTQKLVFWPNFDHFWPLLGSKNLSTKKFLVVI